MKSVKIKLYLLTFSLLAMSCAGDDAGQIINNDPTTFEIIANSDNHTTLEQLLADANLVDVINSDVYTIFAPTDAAFSEINLTDYTAEQLKNILLNHLISGNVSSLDLANAYYKTNATESYSGNNNFIDVYVNVDGGIFLNGISEVDQEDISASNGTVHVVGSVIPIADLGNLTNANPNFSSLSAALTQEDLIATLFLDADTPPAPLSLFAPSENAFQNFLDEDEEDAFETIEDILESPSLADILTYHLTSGALRENNIVDQEILTTLQGQTIQLNVGDTLSITDQKNRTTPIKTTDVTGSNGVIHVLENVLLPNLD